VKAVKAASSHKLPTLRVDKRKALEAVLYILENFQGYSQYDIVKTIFLADKAHLKRYGRPITFDNYFAMKNGPVPSFTYDMLKPDFDFRKEFGEDRPFISVPDTEKSNVNKFVGARRKANSEYLSETDKETLKEAGSTILLLDFEQIYRLTHDDPAYKEAWERRGSTARAQMDFALLGADEKLIDDLIYISNHVA
jgi:hypothetical protein